MQEPQIHTVGSTAFKETASHPFLALTTLNNYTASLNIKTSPQNWLCAMQFSMARHFWQGNGSTLISIEKITQFGEV